MGLYDNFPYTNTHELNTDWIVKKIGDIDDSVNAAASSEANAKASEEAAKSSEEASALSQQAAYQSAESAAEYADSISSSAAQIEANTRNIAENTQDIETIENLTAQNTADISTNSSRIDNILAQGTPTEGNAELIDGRTSDGGNVFTLIGDNIRYGQALQNTDKNFMYEYKPVFRNVKKGFYSTNDGTYNASRNDYFCSSDGITLAPGESVTLSLTEALPDPGTIYFQIFNTNLSYVSSQRFEFPANLYQTGGLYKYINTQSNSLILKVSITFGSQHQNAISYAPYFWFMKNHLLFSLKSILNSGEIIRRFNAWLQPSYLLFSDGSIGYDGKRLSIGPYIHAEKSGTITVNDDYQIAIGRFPNANLNISELLNTPTWGSSFRFNANEYIMINLAKYPASSFLDMTIKDAETAHIVITYDDEVQPITSYAVSNLVKKSIDINALTGTISGKQSFVINDDKIYSFENNNMYIQDMATMNLIQTITISTGHANGAQLVGNIAYVSGWNDNKVHKINISTYALEDITLPITGYTNVLYDEYKNLYYVLQRDDYPDTESVYNLITVDASTLQIVNNKKTDLKAAALQSVDFVKGLFIGVYGLGTTEAPSGMFVMNTNGEIVTWYNTNGLIESTEPEGVFYDTENDMIYFSTISGDLYRI